MQLSPLFILVPYKSYSKTCVQRPKIPLQLPKLKRPHPKPNLESTEIPDPVKISTLSSKRSKSHGSSCSDILKLMDALKLPVQTDIYSSLLKECSDSKDLIEGHEIHKHILESGHRLDLLLCNRLLLMYVSGGDLMSAQKLFDEMPVRDSITWATLMAGYYECGHPSVALILFINMLADGLMPSSLIIVCVLKACVVAGKMEIGRQVHGLALKLKMMGVNDSVDLYIGTSLMNFYGKIGCLETTRKLFDYMSIRDSAVWVALMIGYGKIDKFQEIFAVFLEMGRHEKKMKKNKFVYSYVLKACARIGDGGKSGMQVHADVIKTGIDTDVYVGSSLVDMYGKCGLVEDARRAFETIYAKNQVSWNAMLTSYARFGLCNQAIRFLYQMKGDGICLDESLLNQVRIACG